jgi:hypothetical protein
MGQRSRLRILAVAAVGCLVAAGCPEAAAATAWTVGLNAANAPTARSVSLPVAPGKPDAHCDFIIGSTIDVSWSAVAGARGYSVYRNGSFLKSVSSATLSIQDSLLSLLGSYYYTVTADIVSRKWSSPQSPKSDSHSIVLLVGCV